MERMFTGKTQDVYDRAKTVEEKLKYKMANAEKLNLSTEDIRFIEVSLEYIKEYLEWYSKTLL